MNSHWGVAVFATVLSVPANANPGDAPSPVMVRIEAGATQLGTAVVASRQNVDESLHRVTITRPFFLGVTEVSQAQWNSVMEENPSINIGSTLPVDNVSWEDAVTFCNRLSIAHGLDRAYFDAAKRVAWNPDANGFRLPTEAEWEYAARAGTTTPFHFGELIDVEMVNFTGAFNYWPTVGSRPREGTAPVGSFPPNAWGLHEVHGNVAEWVWDFAAPYPGHDRVDPRGPRSGERHVLRGGGWHDNGRLVRSADRRHRNPVPVAESDSLSAVAEPDGRFGGDLGFRVARSPVAGAALEPHEIGGISMVPVPRGEFSMGSPADEAGRAVLEPLHEARVTRPFLIGATEVTRGQWNRLMHSEASDEEGCATCPVGRVSFFSALRYCNALSIDERRTPVYRIHEVRGETVADWNPDADGYRLPTEAEWVLAAHGAEGAGTAALASADEVIRRGWIASNSGGKPHPVATLEANDSGLFDYYGNAWEWVWDRYGPFDAGPAVDPTGPDAGVMRVKRGGSWATHPAVWADPPVRNGLHPESGATNPFMGFRVARNAP